jgi:hypothetical protein
LSGALRPKDKSSEEVKRKRDASYKVPDANPSETASLTNDSARLCCAEVSGVPPSTRRRKPSSSCTEAGACRDGDAGGVRVSAREADTGAGDRALAASEDESPRRLGAASSTRAVSGPGAESGAAFAAVSPRVGEARVASPTASTDAPIALRRGRAARRAKDSCNNGAESVSLRSWSSWRADA